MQDISIKNCVSETSLGGALYFDLSDNTTFSNFNIDSN